MSSGGPYEIVASPVNLTAGGGGSEQESKTEPSFHAESDLQVSPSPLYCHTHKCACV